MAGAVALSGCLCAVFWPITLARMRPVLTPLPWRTCLNDCGHTTVTEKSAQGWGKVCCDPEDGQCMVNGRSPHDSNSH